MLQRLSILIFHRVLARPDPLQPDVATAAGFEARMRWLRRFFRVLPLSEAVARLGQGRLPARAVALTFDDGYADNAEVALPILRRLELPATFFIATGFLNGGRMWNDTVIEAIRRCKEPEIQPDGLDLGPLPCTTDQQRRAAIGNLLGALKYFLPEERKRRADALAEAIGAPLPRLMMSESQVRQLKEAGMEVGAHTVNHPILAVLDEDAARREIQQSKERLEAVLRQPVRLFAYPNGKPGWDYTDRDVALVRELAFQAAVSTGWGTASGQTDTFQLPRFTPWDRSIPRFMGRLAYMRWMGPRGIPKGGLVR